MKLLKIISAALILSGCAHTQHDKLSYSERMFFHGYASHLAAFNALPTLDSEVRIRLPEFDLIVLPNDFKCGEKITSGCLTKTLELQNGTAVMVYQIRLTGREVADKIYLNPDTLAHEVEHLLHRENPNFVDPHEKYN